MEKVALRFRAGRFPKTFGPPFGTKATSQVRLSALWFLDRACIADSYAITATGSASCVGLLGPGLGGGHGRWQGYYGLVSDNFIKLNVVLANGSATTVSSDTAPDLFWAMKGAGHNFGIVTSFEMKIYDRGPDTWYYKIYMFNETKIEAVFDALNVFRQDEARPKEMAVNYGAYTMNASISDTEASNSISQSSSAQVN